MQLKNGYALVWGKRSSDRGCGAGRIALENQPVEGGLLHLQLHPPHLGLSVGGEGEVVEVHVPEGGQVVGHQLLRVVAPAVALRRHIDPGVALRLHGHEDHGAVFQHPVPVEVHGPCGGVTVDCRPVVVPVLPAEPEHTPVLAEAVLLVLHLQQVGEWQVLVDVPAVVGVVQDQSLSALQKPVFVVALDVEGPNRPHVEAAHGLRHPV